MSEDEAKLYAERRVRRHRAAEAVRTDPAARARYHALLDQVRQHMGVDDPFEAIADLMSLHVDLEPRPPVYLRAGDPTTHPRSRDRQAMYTTISIPVADADRALPQWELQRLYAFSEVLVWLQGGITPAELSAVSPRAWSVIMAWVDEQRGMVRL